MLFASPSKGSMKMVRVVICSRRLSGVVHLCLLFEGHCFFLTLSPSTAFLKESLHQGESLCYYHIDAMWC